MKKIHVFIIAFFAMIGSSFAQIKETRVVGNFTAIKASTSVNVVYTQGATQSIVVSWEKDLMKYLKVEAKNNILRIYIDNDKYFKNIGWNSRISSIDVPPGFVVHLYKGDGLREYSKDWGPFDKKWTINAPLSNNSEMNDQISSVQIERAPGFQETYEISNKFVSSNLGNLFKIAGSTEWQIKHQNGGYYKLMTKQEGATKCLHYDNLYNLLLNTCMNTPNQLYMIQERIGTSEKGLYEIMTKKYIKLLDKFYKNYASIATKLLPFGNPNSSTLAKQLFTSLLFNKIRDCISNSINFSLFSA